MHRPATFAALLSLTRAASAIGDFWVNAAKAVNTFLRVSVRGWSRVPGRARWRSRLSRLSNVSTSSRSAYLGVTVS
ncbi:hypothetical protein [Streptomyces sp. NPDC088246]|uniref:hypothetical protein n=1 Tax=Streptomyces sp. NPDC088246 TaxID=3365842 RepID=UPI0037FC7FA2